MILIVSLPQLAVALRVIISDIVVTYELSLCVLHTTLCLVVAASLHPSIGLGSWLMVSFRKRTNDALWSVAGAYDAMI